MYIATTSQMKSAERIAAERSSFLELMENAGEALAEEISHRTDISGRNVLVLCGKGNNGGDGFVCARLLDKMGADVTVLLLIDQAPTGIAGQEFSELSGTGVKIIAAGEYTFEKEPDVIIDAVFGTGFKGELPENIVQAFSSLSACQCLKVAADCPSGVNCDTGSVSRGILVPDITVTFGTIKTGMTLFPAKNCCGEIIIRPIGITEADLSSTGFVAKLCDDTTAAKALPKRTETSHKGNFGKLCIIGGSTEYSGAVAMNVKAALRSGAGLVRLAAIPRVCDRVAAKVDECVYTELIPSEAGTISFASVDIAEECIAASTAVLYGSGLKVNDDTLRLTREVLNACREKNIPIVIDADGLNCIAQLGKDILKGVNAVLTPHPAELARLIGMPVSFVLEDRLSAASELAEETGCIVTAKGFPTYIVSPDKRVYASYTGNAGLSRGGSGDVLAGMTAGMITAQKGDRIFDCAAAAVYYFGKAADITADEISQHNMLPTDVIGRIRF